MSSEDMSPKNVMPPDKDAEECKRKVIFIDCVALKKVSEIFDSRHGFHPFVSILSRWPSYSLTTFLIV